MCGIVGVVQFANEGRLDCELLARMRDTMVRRRPDGMESWISNDGSVGLGHRRLSILDLTDAAAQPMSDAAGFSACAAELPSCTRLAVQDGC